MGGLNKRKDILNVPEGHFVIYHVYPDDSLYEDRPILILCHGITYSSLAVYDVPIEGGSLAEEMANLGYHIFMPDFLGYGSSSNKDHFTVTIDTAVNDIVVTVAYIRKKGLKGPVALLGWSWGSQVAAHFVMRNPYKVHALILYGFKWHIDRTKLREPTSPWRINSEAHLREDFTVADNIRQDVLSVYIEHALAINPSSPNGARRELFNKALPADPLLIDLPVLVIHGHGDEGVDLQDNLKFFHNIKSREKHYSIVYGAHPLHLEKSSRKFQKIVDHFLCTYLR